MSERFYTHVLPAILALVLAVAIPYVVLAAERAPVSPNDARALETQTRQSGQHYSNPMDRNAALREAGRSATPQSPGAPAQAAPLPANPAPAPSAAPGAVTK